MMTHRTVMTSSLRIKNFNNCKNWCFSSDIDYNCQSDVFSDVIYLIFCEPKRPLGAFAGAKRAAQACEARLYIIINRISIVRIRVIFVNIKFIKQTILKWISESINIYYPLETLCSITFSGSSRKTFACVC